MLHNRVYKYEIMNIYKYIYYLYTVYTLYIQNAAYIYR